MEIIDKSFKEKILENLENLGEEPKQDFLKAKNLFDKTYVVGGFVRDSILDVLYGYNFPLNDLDILIEDKDFSTKKLEFSQENSSRLKGLKLKYRKFEMDLFNLGEVYFLENSEKNIENYLKGCDLSTSSLAYDLSKDKLYGSLAIKELMNKEINLIKSPYLIFAPTISRLILHADKMDFKIGEGSLSYIRENYSQNLDKEIQNWLDYKKIPHLFPLVKSKIDSILK